VTFDEPNLVANAGLVLIATVAKRLGLERLCDTTIELSGRVGGFRPGRKILTLVHAMVAGASHIDHADMLRAGASAEVLEHRVMAPSTLGTFLRSFTFGRVRQFERVIGEGGDRCRLGARGGSGRRTPRRRHRLDHQRGPRQEEAGCRLIWMSAVHTGWKFHGTWNMASKAYIGSFGGTGAGFTGRLVEGSAPRC
jgi:hypothetical protein